MTHKTRWTLEELTRRLALIEPLVCRRSGLGGGGGRVDRGGRVAAIFGDRAAQG